MGLALVRQVMTLKIVAVLALGIEGETEIGEIFINSQWIRQRNVNLATRLGLAVKRSNVDFTSFNVAQGVDRLTVLKHRL